jgi:pyocin large subunit-like protein
MVIDVTPRRASVTGLDTRRLFRFVASFLLMAALLAAGGPGFRSKKQFREHYAKHGEEFGDVTAEQYLALAQQLRDTPKGADILEDVRTDGVITKFDRRHGYFGAYNPDRTIRTFFIPNRGEEYYRRQINTTHN